MCILISIEDTTTFQKGYTNLDLLHFLIIITNGITHMIHFCHIVFFIFFCMLIITRETENLLKNLFQNYGFSVNLKSLFFIDKTLRDILVLTRWLSFLGAPSHTSKGYMFDLQLGRIQEATD